MANYGPASSFIYVGGRVLSGDVFTLEETVEQVTEETHGLGDLWEETLPAGIAKVSLSAGNGLYDDRVAGNNDAFVNKGATQQVISYGMATDAVGAPIVMMDGMFANKYKRVMARDGITKAGADFTISGQYYRGNSIKAMLPAQTVDPGDNKSTPFNFASTAGTAVNPTRYITAVSIASPGVVTSPLHGLTTGDVITIAGTNVTPTINGVRTVTVVDANNFTVAINTTVVTLGTGTWTKLSSQNALIDVHVSTITLGGFTNLTFQIVHSVDASTWVNLGSTLVFTTYGALRIAVVGAIRQYVAITWDWIGAGAGQTAQFHAGIAR